MPTNLDAEEHSFTRGLFATLLVGGGWGRDRQFGGFYSETVEGGPTVAGVVGVKGSRCQCSRQASPLAPAPSPQPPARTHFSYSFLHLLRFISWNVSGVERGGIPNRIFQFQTFPPTFWVDTEDLIVKSQHMENRAMAFQPAPESKAPLPMQEA